MAGIFSEVPNVLVPIGLVCLEWLCSVNRDWKRKIEARISSFLLFFVPLAVCCAQDPCLILGSPFLTNNQFQFSLTGESGVSYVIESSRDLENWAPVATNSDSSISREIAVDAPNSAGFYRANRGPLPMFIAALAGRQKVDLVGNGITTDSYDSSDVIHFPGGFYNVSNRLAGGDVACEAGITNVTDVSIYGHVRTGPNANFSLGSNGRVGDLNWVGPGIEPGWWNYDFRFCFPEVKPPYTSGLALTFGSGTNNYILGSGQYYQSGNFLLKNNESMYVSGNANLYVTGNLSMSGTASIVIAPGASLKLFIGNSSGPAVSASLGLVNTSGNASTFQFYGLPTLTTLAWGGNAAYLGIVYAPEGSFTIGGRGSGTNDFQGGITVQAISMNGHFNVHFDENLKRSGPTR